MDSSDSSQHMALDLLGNHSNEGNSPSPSCGGGMMTTPSAGGGLSAGSYGSGSHYSHTCDADLGYTSDTIVRPVRAALGGDLQVHVHGVALAGAKSRVETQIRMRLELVRPVPSTSDARDGEERVPKSTMITSQEAAALAAARFGPCSAWQRIGSFTHIKLPPMTGTRRKSKKTNKNPPQVDPEKTLFLDATVVNATPPHARVFVCDGCRARERKRILRTKTSKKGIQEQAAKLKAQGKMEEAAALIALADGGGGNSEPQPSAEEMREMGIDPTAPDAVANAMAIQEERAKRRVVLFNTGDYVEFDQGEAVLPTRITCYCRHHKEKVGFCIIFTLRDWTGELLATGTTPPIMITDDHKTVTAQGQMLYTPQPMRTPSSNAPTVMDTTPAAALAAPLPPSQQSQVVSPNSLNNGPGKGRHRAVSADETGLQYAAAAAAAAAASTNGSKARRSKPYSRRATASSSAATSPHSTTQAASAMYVNGMAMERTPSRASNAATNPSTSAVSPASASNSTAASPQTTLLFDHVAAQGDALSRLAEAMRQLPQQGTAADANSSSSSRGSPVDLLPSTALQGSLSPTTLETTQGSEPQFDFGEFLNEDAQMTSIHQPLQQCQQQQPQSQHFVGSPSQPHGQRLPMQMSPPSFPGSIPQQQQRAPAPMTIFDAITHNETSVDRSARQTPPKVTRLIPAEGPTAGGIEVTILGENFVDGITCVFGDTAAISTKVWASNTLVCMLPPAASPGPVIVSLMLPTFGLNDPHANAAPSASGAGAAANGTSANGAAAANGNSGSLTSLAFFNYVEMTDRSLMELALQVVGLQMTGQMQSARDVAMRVVGSGHNESTSPQNGTANGAGPNGNTAAMSAANQYAMLAAVAASRKTDGNMPSFQDSIISFLTVLDVDLSSTGGRQRRDAVRLANKQGQTLLHLAVSLGFQKLVDDLLRRGAPVNARDHSGFTALHFACLYGRMATARKLLDHHASVDVINAAGRTPLDLARTYQQNDLVDLLESQENVCTARSVSEITDSGLSFDEAAASGESDLSYSDDSESDSEADDADEESCAESEDDTTPTALRSPAAEKEAEAQDEQAAFAADAAAMASKLLSPPYIPRFFTRTNSDGIDWAQKLSHMQSIMPTMPTMMPTVQVFNMALPTPSALMHWPTAGSSSGSNKGTDKDSTSDSEDGHGKMYHLLRSLLEQRSLPWTLAAATQPPPPAYEAAIGEETGAAFTDKSIDRGEGSSTPALSRAAESSARSSPVPSSSYKGKAKMPSSGTSTPTEATTSPHAAKTVARHLRDDRMLVWFWLPALLLVTIIMIFSSSSSVLSLADLASYIPLGQHHR